MTIQEKILQLLDQREISLSSLNSLGTLEIETEEELNFHYRYLFGHETDEGIINILEMYFREIFLSSGRTTSPSMHAGIGESENAWKNIFEDSLKTAGDGVSGFYPFDSSLEMAQMELNESSVFLTTNSLTSENNGGLIKLSNDVSSDVSAIQAERTTSENYYSGNEKTNFESKLNNLISDADDYKNYINDVILVILNKIFEEENGLFEELNITSIINLDDISEINGLSNSIDDFVENLTKNYNYFSQFDDNDILSLISYLFVSTTITEIIGEAASENGDGRGPAGFQDEAGSGFESQEEAEIYRDDTKGSGLLGKRTENSEVYSVTTGEGEEAVTKWYVGQNGIDIPNYYDEPEKNNLETNLISTINDLTSFRNFVLAKSFGFINKKLSTDAFGIDDQNLLDSLQTDIDFFQGKYDFFFAQSHSISTDITATTTDFNNNLNLLVDSFSPGGIISILETDLQNHTSNFNSNLVSLENDLSNPFNTTFIARNDFIVNTNLGTDPQDNNKIRNWLLFWIKQIIGKFNGVLVKYINTIKAKINAEVDIKNSNSGLVTLFGTEYEKFLVPPTVFAAFFNPIIDEETGEIVERKVGIVWMANLAANRYNIYRKKVDSLTAILDNEAQWAAADEINQHAEMNDKNTMVKSEYADNDAALQDGGLFVYRVKSFDTNENPKAWDRIDSFLGGSGQNTSSQQSNIVGDTFTIASIDKNIIELTEEPANNFGVCFINNKYYGVLKVKKEKIILAEEVIGASSTLIEIKGGVYVP